MFNVCGVTYDHTTNYGSCLQAYALSMVLKNCTVSGERICYDIVPYVQLCKKEYVPLKNGLYGWTKNLLNQMLGLHFREFDNTHFSFANLHSTRELESLNKQYDAFVCGSDVIWNPAFNGNSGVYFLDFARKYAFSYAASFGNSDLSEKYLTSVRTRLSRLQRISVREASGKRIVEENTGHKAEIVADPTILLPREAWDKLADMPKNKSEYVFVYYTHFNTEFKEFVKKIHSQTGLKIIQVAWGPKSVLMSRTYPPSPERWIGLIKNAKYVVTNSFHCSVFCTMYHKDFYTVVHGPINKGINIRMNEFLESMGLNDRIYNYVPENIDLSSPDFTKADETIRSLRAKSLQFLHDNLEKAYEEKCRSVSPEML